MSAQEMLYRKLGKTGQNVSVIGIGGGHIGSPALDEQLSIRLIRSAIDRGITFMDNSWDYNGGVSEIRMGKALREGYRDRVFLMTKIDGRSKKEAIKQLDESLRRLRVDVVDLVQHHEVIRYEDPHRIFDEEGANAALVEARNAGKIRYIGFTGHKDPRIHAYMLKVAAKNGFVFDTVQMPLNVMDAHYRSFEKGVLPELTSQGIGAIAMKTMACGILLRSGAVTPVECLHYVLNLPVSTVVTGIDSVELLDQACEAVRTFHPMSDEEIRILLSRTARPAELGAFELFKTTTIFDGTLRHPDWLGDEPEKFRQFMPEE
jgi:aryl-alcohol dehydrogenase-like predicted oxidoreductase